MRNSFLLFSGLVAVVTLASGCANVERKFGRGMANTQEIVRWGDYRRSVEQGAVFNSPEHAYTTSAIQGFNRSMLRTGVGLYELVTAPFPPYGPLCVCGGPAYPDNYKPGIMADSMFETDTHIGFSGGPIAPIVPGNRFQVLSGQ